MTNFKEAMRVYLINLTKKKKKSVKFIAYLFCAKIMYSKYTAKPEL